MATAMVTTKQWAEEHGVKYDTLMYWLYHGLIKGAKRYMSPIGPYWMVPKTAKPLKLKRGRKLGTKMPRKEK